MRLSPSVIRVSQAVMAVFLVAIIVLLSYIVFIFGRIKKDVSEMEDMYFDIYRQSSKTLIESCNLTSAQMADSFCILPSSVINVNEHIPVVVVEDDSVVEFKNLSYDDSVMVSSVSASDPRMVKFLSQFRQNGESRVIDFDQDFSQTLIFGHSRVLDHLAYFSLIQLVLVCLAIFVAFIIVVASWERKQDNVWRGLARETAHQLGTPITALTGWRDMLAMGFGDTEMVATEMSKDIDRLKTVSERFSKIGSKPTLQPTLLADELEFVAAYLRSRTSKNIAISVLSSQDNVLINVEPNLFRWAVENICKNAIDAIDQQKGGSVILSLHNSDRYAIIDIKDTGKGMTPKTASRIFDAGFTTKSKGWGMGLALVHRIVSEYHGGRVFVLDSHVGQGTTFRIMIPK